MVVNRLYNVYIWFFFQSNVDKDQVSAAIKAQQEQQIDNVSISKTIQASICTPPCNDRLLTFFLLCPHVFLPIGTASGGTLLLRSGAN